MSLPTPPGTSHRSEKENRPCPSRVVWSDKLQIHNLTADLPRRISVFTDSAPKKSILKKTGYQVLPCMDDENERETTPEPDDPLADLHYLDSPVSKILKADAAMRDLIEAYNVLSARLRACVSDSTDADASWPLFQPMRKHRDALVQAMCRDLGRALEDITFEEEAMCEVRGLPSPEKSPKKRGMTAEQAKHARDLCTTSQAVLKLLGSVFSFPAIYNVFEDSQLCELLTSVLAIPLASSLPTPNARKTCALAIWLLQAQRLTAEVLGPASTRIAYALRRGIEGELGKEGKKGAASDGLRAIHDLSLQFPHIFVPAFVEVVPSVLSQLLAPTVTLRIQACHALGGFSFALASLPTSATHTRVAGILSLFLTKAPLGSPCKKPTSPVKDPLILRTLRTTLTATDPKHPAQGPVWGLSVVSHFIVMLGAQIFLDERLSRVILSLLTLGLRHCKSSVRCLCCIVWRCLVWAYFQPWGPKLVSLSDADEDGGFVFEEEEEYTNEEQEICARRIHKSWDHVCTVLEMSAGVSTIAAVLGSTVGGSNSDEALERALDLLSEMTEKRGVMGKEAIYTLAQLVNASCTKTASADGTFDGPATSDDDSEWNPMKLLPMSLFSGYPGLLTVEYNALPTVVRPLLAECPNTEDVRALTRDELCLDWVFDKIIDLWKALICSVQCAWDKGIPDELVDIWSGLWQANASALNESNDESGVAQLALRAADILTWILRSDRIDLAQIADKPNTISVIPRGLPMSRWKPALKLRLVRELWEKLRRIFPPSALIEPAERLLVVLDRKEANLVVKLQLVDEVRAEWALLCAEVIQFCDEKAVQAFWGMRQSLKRREWSWTDSVKRMVWSQFVQKWQDDRSSWEGAIVLLGAPFLDINAWEMTDEDLEQWDAFLRLTVDRALDFGVDSLSVVDQIAGIVSSQPGLSPKCSTRICDLLLSHLDVAAARSIPTALCELTNETLMGTYPPASNKLSCLWLLRTITRTVDACPIELLDQLLESLQDGLSLWVSDEAKALTRDEYGMDIAALYQTASVVLMSLPARAETLYKFTALLGSAFVGRDDKPTTLSESFLELWETTYATISPPERGWPRGVAACLRAVGLVVEDEVRDVEEVDNLLELVLEEAVLSPEVPSPDTLAARFFLEPPTSPLLSCPATPRTPKSRRRGTTPPRSPSPVSSVAPTFILDSPQRSPMRSPVTPKRRTPSPKKADKENASPLRSITSIAERIAKRSPGNVLGKRPFDVDEGEDLREITKRPRADTSYVFGSNFHEAAPSPFFLPQHPLSAPLLLKDALADLASPSKPSSFEQLPTLKNMRTAKKRNGFVLDAVEVPTLKELRRVDSSILPTTRSLPLPPKDPESPTRQKTLRRTRSATKDMGEEYTFERLRYSPVKKRKTMSPSSSASRPPVAKRRREEYNSDDAWMPSPQKESVPFGSDDSIMFDTEPYEPSIPSSDDDSMRFLGQVTPHRLVSPAVRRLKDYDDFDEPGSDDSNMSASPTTDRVARMSVEKTTPFMRPSPLGLQRSPLF